MKHSFLATLLVMSLTAPLFAQDYGDFYYSRCYWYSSLEAAKRAGATASTTPRPPGTLVPRSTTRRAKKYILVYLQPASELKEPSVFRNTDIINASHYRGTWAYVKFDFEKDHPILKKWGVRAPGTVVALDIKGNHFATSRNLSITGVRNILKGTPALIEKYKVKLAAEYKRALTTLTRDRKRGIKYLVEVVKKAKNGYREADEAIVKLDELADGDFKQAELAASISPADGVTFLKGVAKIYAGTPPEARALIAIARLQHSQGKVKEANLNLRKVTRLDPESFRREIAAAQMLLEEISRNPDGKLPGSGASGGPDKLTGSFLTKGLVGHWSLDDGKGNNASDSSGSRIIGIIKGGGSWTKGVSGGAIQLDGVDDHVVLGNEALFDFMGPFSVAFWMKSDGFSQLHETIVAKGNTSWRIQRFRDSDHMCFNTHGLSNRSLKGYKTVNDGAWHHVTAVYDGFNKLLYVDGDLDASAATTGTTGTNDSDVRFGGGGQSVPRHFKGKLDEVRIYKVALSASDVKRLATSK